ncbi:MAG: class I SAM-dependent methyltransferase, partial [Proteobacteria bacterium]|nr:class I SAM-dependent methyltransferase [Pseudomonadota bacterium]
MHNTKLKLIDARQKPGAMPFNIEPLEKLARFSFDWAPMLCRSEHRCGDYHRVWSIVRLASPNGPDLAGWEFYHRALAMLPRAEAPPRILIAGGADTGLMSLVVAGFEALGIQPQLIFVDRCETTVLQNKRLSTTLGLDAEHHVADMLNFQCDPVDAIVAHSFLNFFSPAERQQLFLKWSTLLR